MGRGNSGAVVLDVHGDLVALGVDEAGARLVFGGEGDLALQRLDLVVVEELAVLVAVLDLLLAREEVGRGRVRGGRLRRHGTVVAAADFRVACGLVLLLLLVAGDCRGGGGGGGEAGGGAVFGKLQSNVSHWDR